MLAYVGMEFLDTLDPVLTGKGVFLSVPWAIYGDGGLMTTMSFVLWFEPLKNFLMNLYDPMYYLQLFKQRRAIATNGKYLTQAQAHELFEGPGPSIEKRYGSLVAAMLMTVFFAPAFPIALFFAAAGLTMNYWADKYIFLRRMALPNYLGPQIQQKVIANLEAIILFFAFGVTFFTYNVVSKDPNPAWLTVADYSYKLEIGIAIFYKFIMPVNWFNQLLFPIKKRAILKKSYDEVKHKFLTDYDIENPITRAKAIEERMRTTLATMGEIKDANEEKRLKKSLSKVDSVLKKYSSSSRSPKRSHDNTSLV